MSSPNANLETFLQHFVILSTGREREICKEGLNGKGMKEWNEDDVGMKN